MTDDSTPQRVGDVLRRARVAVGLSKREAARRANVAEVTWRNLETGIQPLRDGHQAPMNPRPETIINAARAVGVSPRELLDLAGHHDVEYIDTVSPATSDAADVDLLATLVDEVRGLASEVRELRAAVESRRPARS